VEESGSASGGPDAAAARRQYERAAPGYDRHMRLLARWQRLAVERLQLRPGQSVVDVACGTGLNFPRLLAGVGPEGRVIGIDLSPEMLAQARQRVASQGWSNFTVIESSVEEAEIPVRADAALFSFTHDVLQSPAAVANVVAHLKPGAHVACVGPKLVGRWGFPVNFAVRRVARPYITTLRGLDAPWRELEQYSEELRIKQLALGGAYLGWGHVSAAGSSEAASELSSAPAR
jgi:SAM-dependent methyltransferase